MKKKQIIHAWRDEDYYLSLPPVERMALPEHPAGTFEDAVLQSVTGGGCSIQTCAGCGFRSILCTPCPPSECGA